MAEMSPVELLQAGAVAAEGGPRPQGGSWLLGELGKAIAALLRVHVDDLEHDLESYTCGAEQLEAAMAVDMAQLHHGEALRVARVLLGVPDGH